MRWRSERNGARHVRLLEPRDLVLAERQLLGGERVLEMRELRRADDRRRDARLVQQPRERDLRRREAACCSNFSEPVDDRGVELGLVQQVGERVGLGACRQWLSGCCLLYTSDAADE